MPRREFLVYPVQLGATDNLKEYINPTVNTEIRNLSSECFMIVHHNGYSRTGDRYADLAFNKGTDIVFTLPCYPDQISESQSANWSQSQPLGRSSPISTFTGTGYRTFGLNFRLHREMVNGDEEYIDRILVELRRSVFPFYVEKGLQPPVTTFQFGKFRCKGYVESVSFSWQKPIIDGYYQCCDVSLNFVDVPDSVFSASDLNSVPTNPYNRPPIKGG